MGRDAPKSRPLGDAATGGGLFWWRRTLSWVAAAAGRGEAIEIGLPELIAMAAEVVEDIPRIESTVVTIGKNRTDGLVTDRFDAHNGDIAFADL